LGNLDDVPDLGTVPDGTEANLQIISLELKQQKPEKGTGKFIMVGFDIIGEPNTKRITHIMMLPAEGDDEKKRNYRLRSIRTFYEAFAIPTSGQVNLGDYVGNAGWAILAEEESEGFGMQNRIRKFIAG
jgi:hypothetical protein